MLSHYYPSTTQACFEYNAIAHHHGTLNSEDYLDRMLAHFSGVRHTEDESMMTLHDPLSMVFYTCIEYLNNNKMKVEDTSSIKKLILHSWFGEMSDVIAQTQLVLDSLDMYGISTEMYEGLLCIACMTGRVELLKYFLTLDNHLMRLAGSYLRPLQFAITRTSPDVEMWSVLLERGLYLDGSSGNKFDPTHSLSSPEDEHIGSYFNSWAHAALSLELPATELLDFLFKRGFVVAENFFREAVAKMNPEFVQWLLTKCDPELCTGYRLFSAVHNTPQMVDFLLDTGIDVNFTSGPGCSDPFRSTPGDVTALHEAARLRRADMARLLLERGANKFARNSWGQTPEDEARQQLPGPYSEIVDLIHNFVPSLERYMPPEPEKKSVECTPVMMSRGKNWTFVEKNPESELLIDFSKL